VISALSSRGPRAESLLSIGTILSGSGKSLKKFEVISLFDGYYPVSRNAYIMALFTQGGWHRAVSHNVVWMTDKDKICGRRTWHLVGCLPLTRQCRGLLMCVSLLLYKGSSSWRASKMPVRCSSHSESHVKSISSVCKMYGESIRADPTDGKQAHLFRFPCALTEICYNPCSDAPSFSFTTYHDPTRQTFDQKTPDILPARCSSNRPAQTVRMDRRKDELEHVHHCHSQPSSIRARLRILESGLHHPGDGTP